MSQNQKKDRYVEEAINQYVTDKGIAISAISARTGVPGNALYKSLRGTRKIRGDELLAVCNFIGVDPREFYNAS